MVDNLDRGLDGMPLLPRQRCEHCDEVIEREPVTREIATGPANSLVGWLYFCSDACEENDRVAGSEPDYPEEGR